MGLQEEINSKKKDISTDGYPMSIGELISLYKDKELDIHPEFQRIFRWNEKQKSQLIESIMLGIPIPSIFVSQRADGVWDVVDGLQRLSTIFEFVGVLRDENDTLLPPSVLVRTEYLPSLEKKMWDNQIEDDSFDAPQRMMLKREKIDIKIVKKESDEAVKFELFQRLNTLGSKLSDQEVRNCLLVMLNKDFYSWLKDLSEDPNFLDTISLADRLIDEKYNMELALRFIILSEIDPNEVKGLNDFSDFVTKKMVAIATDPAFDRDSKERQFRSTFDLLNRALGDSAFKKYAENRDVFQGKFLIAAFESVAIGLGANVDNWRQQPFDDAMKTTLTSKVKSIWTSAAFQAKYGSGVNVTSRVPVIVPIGKATLVP